MLFAAIDRDCGQLVIGQRLATEKHGNGDRGLGMASKPTGSLLRCVGQIGDRVGKPGKRVGVDAVHETQEYVVEHVELPAAKPMAVGDQQMSDLA